MDVTISQFILEEFDVNCSLLDRLHETFLESSSIPFLGFDGRKRYLVQGSGKASEVLRFGLFCDAKWVAFVLSQLLLLPLSVSLFNPRSVLQCHHGSDRDLLAQNLCGGTRGETLPGVLQWDQIQHHK